MGIKENWWRFNYHTVRLLAVPVVKRVLGTKIRAEGNVPNIRPLMLAPIHRTSVDTFAVSNVVKEFISYVSTDSFGHTGCVNFLQKHTTKAMGSVIWQKSGMTNSRQRALALARDVDDRLDRRLIVAAFTQGEYQSNAVESVEDGLIGLLRRYERREQSDKGHDLRIPIVPVGIEYNHGTRGLVVSKPIGWLIKHIPYFPKWIVPAFGSEIVIRFGELQYFDDRNARTITEVVMQDAAKLSGIPYEVKSQ